MSTARWSVVAIFTFSIIASVVLYLRLFGYNVIVMSLPSYN